MTTPFPRSGSPPASSNVSACAAPSSSPGQQPTSAQNARRGGGYSARATSSRRTPCIIRGASAPYTFAYPCGETRIGKAGESYVGLVAERFLAARGVEPRIADPRRDPLTLVPAHDGAKSCDELIALVEGAAAEGGWLVLLFHGVGGDHMAVERDVHTALADHLARNRSRIWTERFGAVAAHVRAWREAHSTRDQ
jgi:hypothetical protein